jgi:hypothetical protein
MVDKGNGNRDDRPESAKKSKIGSEGTVGGAGKLSGNMSNGRIKAVTFSDRMLMLG